MAMLLPVLMWAMPAHACSEPATPTFRQQLDTADSVVIVRLLSLGLVDKAHNTYDVAGRVEVVRVLKGQGGFSYLRHERVRCGGLNLQVGNYYLIATDQQGKVLQLQRGDRSIVDVSSDYASVMPPRPSQQLWQTQIADYLAGRPLPPKFDPTEIMLRVQAFPPAPGKAW